MYLLTILKQRFTMLSLLNTRIITVLTIFVSDYWRGIETLAASYSQTCWHFQWHTSLRFWHFFKIMLRYWHFLDRVGGVCGQIIPNLTFFWDSVTVSTLWEECADRSWRIWLFLRQCDGIDTFLTGWEECVYKSSWILTVFWDNVTVLTLFWQGGRSVWTNHSKFDVCLR